MVRIVIRLTTLAKIAAGVAAIGGGLAIYGNLKQVSWAGGVGTIMLFGGAIVYYFERYRMITRRRRELREESSRQPGPHHE